MKILLPLLTSGASRAGRHARSTSSMAPPLFRVAHTPRFQTYLGPVKYSNMAADCAQVRARRNPECRDAGHWRARCLPFRTETVACWKESPWPSLAPLLSRTEER